MVGTVVVQVKTLVVFSKCRFIFALSVPRVDKCSALGNGRSPNPLTALTFIRSTRGSPNRNLLRSNTPNVDLSFCAFIAFDSRGKKSVSARWVVTAKKGLVRQEDETPRNGPALDGLPDLPRSVVGSLGE